MPGPAASESWLTEWAEPLEMALSTGAGFSQGFLITDPEQCNDIGQIDQGRIVLITDAFCYSTTDIFSAGFQDHELGMILGVHDNTGAGGAEPRRGVRLSQRRARRPHAPRLVTRSV